MAKLQLSKIGRPAKGRSRILINRPMTRRAVKPIDKNAIFPNELAVPAVAEPVAPADSPGETV